DADGLAELIPRVPRERYRFTVQVRQVRYQTGSLAGVYFGHASRPTPEGVPGHTFIQWGFLESDEAAQKERDPKHEIPGVRWGVRDCQVRACYQPPGSVMRNGNHAVFFHDLTEFPAGRGLDGPFSEVGVEVTPEAFRLLWQGREVKQIARPL